MRALRFGDGGLSVVDVPEPSGPGVTVRVDLTGICGTDVSTVAAGASPVVPGHEIVGTTEDGTAVAVQPNLPCSTCDACRSGQSQRCPQSMAHFLGVSVDGGFAESVRVDPSLVRPLPVDMDLAHAALAEPAAVALHALGRLGPEPAEPVLVIGGGSIGLLAAAQLVAAGHPVDLVARHPHQAEAARVLGARPRAAAEMEDSSRRWILDTAGSQSAADLAYRAGCPGARLVSVGALGWAVASSGLSLVKEIDLVPSVIYTPDEFAQAIAWLHAHPDAAAPVVTHRFPLAEAEHAFAVAAGKGAHRSIKVLLSP